MKTALPTFKNVFSIAVLLVLIATVCTYFLISSINSNLGNSKIIFTEIFSLITLLYLIVIGMLVFHIRKYSKLYQYASSVEKKRDTIAEKSDFHKRVADNAPEIITVMDAQTRKHLYVNDAAKEIVGLSSQQIIDLGYNKAIMSRIHPEDLEKMKLLDATVLAEDKVLEFEYRILDKDQNYRWMRSFTRVFKRTENGEIEQLINTSIDINEKKIYQQQLEETRHQALNINLELEQKVTERTKELELEKTALKKETELNKLVSMATADVVRDWDLITHQIVWNENYQKQFGYTKDEIQSDVSSWYNRIHIEDRDTVLTDMNRVLDSQEDQWTTEYRFRKSDGQYASILDRTRILRRTDGVACRMVGCMTDVTVLKNALVTAEYNENKFKKIFDSGMVGMYFSTLDNRITEVNDVFLKMIGYSREEFESSTLFWDKIIPVKYLKAGERAKREVLENGFCTPFEKQYIRKDNTTVPVLVGRALIPGDNPQIIAYAIDLSEKKEIEQKRNELSELVARQQKEFENILLNAPSLISVRRGPELRYTFVNNALKQVMGGKEYLGKTIQEAHPELKDEKGLAAETQVLKSGKPSLGKAYPIKIKKENDTLETGWFDFVEIPVYDANGNIDGLASYGFNVTELVNVTNEIKKSEDRFRLMANSLPQLVWTADPNGTINYYNKSFYDYTGLKLIAKR